MSTVMDTAGGKGRNLSTNAWIGLLIVALLVFAGNTLYATTKAARLGGASTAASNLQVNSQKLANQGREAVGGNADSFTAFKATKAQIDGDVKSLNDRFGQTADVATLAGHGVHYSAHDSTSTFVCCAAQAAACLNSGVRASRSRLKIPHESSARS